MVILPDPPNVSKVLKEKEGVLVWHKQPTPRGSVSVPMPEKFNEVCSRERTL